MKKTEKVIATNEKEIASAYFTLSNMALLHLVKDNKNILNEFNQINGVVWEETECGLEEELKYWKKEVSVAREGDYVFDEWHEKRENYI